MRDGPLRTDPAGVWAWPSLTAQPVLTIVDPPSDTAIFVLGPDVLTIGRDPDCDVFLDDPRCSRRHARIETRRRGTRATNARASIIDCGSTNGTWLNGSRIDRPRPLRPLDKLQIGRTSLIFALRDAAEIEAYQSVIRLATTDALTGLRNRRVFFQTLRREFVLSERNGWPLSIAVLDIDHFKSFNDTHGHDAGDRVLAAVGTCLIEHIRSTDAAFRQGGEEFVVILPQTHWRDALDVILRVHAAIARLVVTGCPPVTASIGVVMLGNEHDTAEALFESADHAMYVAKRTGRNRVTCPNALQERDPAGFP